MTGLKGWDARATTIWVGKHCCALCGVRTLGGANYYGNNALQWEVVCAPPATLLSFLAAATGPHCSEKWSVLKSRASNIAFAREHRMACHECVYRACSTAAQPFVGQAHKGPAGYNKFPAALGTSRAFWFLFRHSKLQPQPAVDENAHP